MKAAAAEISTMYFRRKMLCNLPDKSGVYAFWWETSSGLPKYIYVGKTQTLRNRLEQHWEGSHNKRLAEYIQQFDEDLQVTAMPLPQEKIDLMEKKLICRLRPETNVQKHHKSLEIVDETDDLLIEYFMTQTTTS